jgi:NAD(P)-dependent dehydrogenase (short-subunit alcohol dehydrogenase family)
MQEALDEAVKLIGRNVTGVRGDASNLDDLDRLFDTVKREKGKIDVLFASAGKGEAAKLGEITEQHFDAGFDLIVRGTLFTVQKALPLFNVFADFTNRFVWYRCRWVRAWGSRPSRRPAPVLACRYTPGCSSVCHFER